MGTVWWVRDVMTNDALLRLWIGSFAFLCKSRLRPALPINGIAAAVIADGSHGVARGLS